MSKKIKLKPISVAIGAAFAASLTVSNIASAETAGANPFAMTELSSGYMQLADGSGMKKEMEGTCGGNKDMKKMEGTCGGNKDMKKMEGTCGGNKDMKKMEGKCGGNKDMKKMEGMKDMKKMEGKCGEGKCGGKK